MQYPHTYPRCGENEGNTYVNISRCQEQWDVYNSPLSPMQGQPMQAPPGQPVLFPPGATGQDAPTEAGNFPVHQQMWMQQMQYLQQFGPMPGMAGAPVAPPPYCSFVE